MTDFDHSAIRIGAWLANPARDEISKDELTVKLEPRLMRLLICLAEHAGQVVSIDNLLDEVWKNTIVTQASVYQAIATLRRSLGKDSETPAYIASVARRGYRLLAPVSRVTCASQRSNIWSKETPPAVAVLPFVDMSEDQGQRYFTDGLSVELINLLMRVPGLHVPASTSSFYFRNKSEDIASIALRLMVTHVLEGSVRKSGNDLRITVQLVHAESGYLVWSQRYDRQLDDVFRIQEEIAVAVTSALKVSILGAPSPATEHRTKSEPYTLYLQACAMNQRRTGHDNTTGIDYLHRALALDPHFAPAWAALADLLLDNYWYFTAAAFHEVRRDAYAAAHRALELDRKLAEAHIALARYFYAIDWNFASAEFEVKQALELRPNNPRALLLASELSSARGQPDAAFDLAVKAIDNDPLDPRGLTRLAGAEVGRGNYSEAEAAYRKALELNPTAAGTHYFLASLLIAKGDATAALVEAHLEPDEAFRRTSLALSFGALGQIDDADRELRVLQSTYASRSACQIVEVLAERGEVDMAFEWLDRAFLQRDGGMLKLSSNPLIRNLKNDARLQMILRKLKLLVSLD